MKGAEVDACHAGRVAVSVPKSIPACTFLVIASLCMLLTLVVSAFGPPCYAQPEAGPLSLTLTSGVALPMGEDTQTFTLGGAAGGALRYAFPSFKALSLGAELSYAWSPVKGLGKGLHLFSAGGLARLGFHLTPNLGVALFGDGGYFYGTLFDPDVPPGYNPYLGGGAEIMISLGDHFAVGLGGTYRSWLGLFDGMSVGLATTFTFGSRAAAKAAPVRAQQKPAPEPLTRSSSEPSPSAPETGPSSTTESPAEKQPSTQQSPVLRPLSEPGVSQLSSSGEPLVIEKVELAPIFPVLYKYYDTHSLGKITLLNRGESPIDDITISLMLKQYMDTPKLCERIAVLAPGESRTEDLYALFTTKVLEISEATKTAAQVLVSYTAAGKKRSTEYSETIRMYDRNAITWDDDRKACAFVTAKDPTVMKFAKNVASITKDKGSKAVNANLLSAIAIHEALRLYGVSYVVDPSSSYTQNIANKQAVDYLQYPRQTLDFKAGDCDDLSILYASLLESVGVETAFITVPGHIFMAFSLGLSPDTARKQFLRPDDLILTDTASWVPIEVTERQKSFLDAWQTGAKEWRENHARQQARLYPIHEAWKTYEPVGISGETASISLPSADKIASVYLEEVVHYVDQEIYPQVAKLQAQIAAASGSPEPVNKLGVLYARYGLYDRAEAQFNEALSAGDYLPALVNLGNLRYLTGKMDEALSFYSRAEKLTPDNPVVMLAVARSNHALENYGTAKTVYDRLKRADPVLASRFAYLDLRGDESARAADLAQVNDVVVWEE